MTNQGEPSTAWTNRLSSQGDESDESDSTSRGLESNAIFVAQPWTAGGPERLAPLIFFGPKGPGPAIYSLGPCMALHGMVIHFMPHRSKWYSALRCSSSCGIIGWTRLWGSCSQVVIQFAGMPSLPVQISFKYPAHPLRKLKRGTSAKPSKLSLRDFIPKMIGYLQYLISICRIHT